jgi:uncharacterized membrane protein YcaP (DUF421 family)
MNIKIIIISIVLIIFVSLQYTLNKILAELREIKQILRGKF